MVRAASVAVASLHALEAVWQFLNRRTHTTSARKVVAGQRIPLPITASATWSVTRYGQICVVRDIQRVELYLPEEAKKGGCCCCVLLLLAVACRCLPLHAAPCRCRLSYW